MTRVRRILITPKAAGESLSALSPGLLKDVEAVPTYGRLEDSKRLISLLKGKDAVVLDLESITSGILKSCPKLRIISRFGEGCDAIDLESAKRFGIRIARTRAVASKAVARHTMALILAMTHNITDNDRNLKKGLWLRRHNLPDANMTLGILGLGKIGMAVAEMASSIGFKILAYDTRKIRSSHSFVSSLEELAMSSDIISLHLSLTSDTRNIISEEIIEKLNGKYLVNTARGGLVDERALLISLEKNKLSGYATDVFSREPVSGISGKLAKNPKTICSPHVATLDKITAVKMTEQAVKNILHCLNNEHDKVVSYVV